MIDAKKKLLFAIYVEYQKDLPEMEKINAELLGMDAGVFKAALAKLVHEELITGNCMSTFTGELDSDTKPTTGAIKMIEKMFDINSGYNHVKKIELIGTQTEDDDAQLAQFIKDALIKTDPRYERFFKEYSTFKAYRQRNASW